MAMAFSQPRRDPWSVDNILTAFTAAAADLA
jgi:hypothetical protein